jgi:hypothetical protein
MVGWDNQGENAAAASAAENQTLIPWSFGSECVRNVDEILTSDANSKIGQIL